MDPFPLDFIHDVLPLPDLFKMEEALLYGMSSSCAPGSSGFAMGEYQDPYPEVHVVRRWPRNQQEALFVNVFDTYQVDTMVEESWKSVAAVKHYLATHDLKGAFSFNDTWGWGLWDE